MRGTADAGHLPTGNAGLGRARSKKRRAPLGGIAMALLCLFGYGGALQATSISSRGAAHMVCETTRVPAHFSAHDLNEQWLIL
jgi:hypothetical protein